MIAATIAMQPLQATYCNPRIYLYVCRDRILEEQSSKNIFNDRKLPTGRSLNRKAVSLLFEYSVNPTGGFRILYIFDMTEENQKMQRDFEIMRETIQVQKKLINLQKEKLEELEGQTIAKHGNNRIFQYQGRETILKIIRN